MTLDRETIEAGLGEALEAPATQLCRRQIERFRDLADGNETLVVGCTQEAPLFLEIAEDIAFAADLRFVNLREKAGWSKEGTKAGAKMAALIAEAALNVDGPQMMGIVSAGIVLVIGPGDVAMDAAMRLGERLDVTLVLTGSERPFAPRIADVPVFHGGAVSAKGSFGGFSVSIEDFAAARPSARGALAFDMPSAEPGTSNCDIILDLRGAAPLFTTPDKRSGYFNPDPRDPIAVERALFEIADMVGTFEKPRYVDYQPSLCAHARSEIVGCQRCIDNCPTAAITPSGNVVSIDAGICAGCGNCASVCPTGAARYTMPGGVALLTRLRTVLGTYRKAGGSAPVLLVHDGEHGEAMIDALADHGDGLPANVIPFAVNAVTQWGLDAVLAARAFGAAKTLLLVPPSAADETGGIDDAVRLGSHILDGLGYVDGATAIIAEIDPDKVAAALWAHAGEAATVTALPAAFTPTGGKRDLMHLALSALHKVAPVPVDVLAMPQGSPFGTLQVDTGACTLCLACVGACPANALKDNPDFPRLSFLEEACVQCGLCARTCPEKAIVLEPRLTFTGEARNLRIIKEDQPFECVRCGKPFATRSTIDTIVARMSGHAMFSNPDALKRLQMCSDCRVVDMAENVSDPFASRPRPAPRTTDDYLRERDDEAEKS